MGLAIEDTCVTSAPRSIGSFVVAVSGRCSSRLFSTTSGGRVVMRLVAARSPFCDAFQSDALGVSAEGAFGSFVHGQERLVTMLRA